MRHPNTPLCRHNRKTHHDYPPDNSHISESIWVGYYPPPLPRKRARCGCSCGDCCAGNCPMAVVPCIHPWGDGRRRYPYDGRPIYIG